MTPIKNLINNRRVPITCMSALEKLLGFWGYQRILSSLSSEITFSINQGIKNIAKLSTKYPLFLPALGPSLPYHVTD